MQNTRNPKKDRKLLIGTIALCVLICVMLAIYFGTRGKNLPEVPASTGSDTAQTGSTQGTDAGTSPEAVRSFTVLVVHKDGTEKELSYQSGLKYLGAALDEEGLIGDSDNGLYATVDGETADWNEDQGWWRVFIGDTEATTGLNDIPIQDGQIYKLVYTIGF